MWLLAISQLSRSTHLRPKAETTIPARQLAPPDSDGVGFLDGFFPTTFESNQTVELVLPLAEDCDLGNRAGFRRGRKTEELS